MTTDNPTGSAHDDNDGEKDSLLDNLKEAGQAWVAAGSRLGDVVSDFAGRFRDTPEEERSAGAHAKPDPVTDQPTTAGRFKSAAAEASERLGSVRSTDDLRTATSNFAGHAEDIIRDVAGNARRAAGETRDSESAAEARTAFSTAISSVRDSFDDAVNAVQDRRRKAGEDSPDADSLIADLRSRLDDLISRAGTLSSNDTTPSSANAGSEPDPDIIDGELIAEDNPVDPENKEKDE